MEMEKFELQSMAPGTNIFTMLEEIPVQNEVKEYNYQYLHENISITGIWYYRLKSIDHDGQYNLSEIRSVRISDLRMFQFTQILSLILLMSICLRIQHIP